MGCYFHMVRGMGYRWNERIYLMQKLYKNDGKTMHPDIILKMGY